MPRPVPAGRRGAAGREEGHRLLLRRAHPQLAAQAQEGHRRGPRPVRFNDPPDQGARAVSGLARVEGARRAHGRRQRLAGAHREGVRQGSQVRGIPAD